MFDRDLNNQILTFIKNIGFISAYVIAVQFKITDVQRMKIFSVVQYFNNAAVSTITEKYISFYNMVCIAVLNTPYTTF